MCRIGQNDRCKETGCEFSKHFGGHCYGEKIKNLRIPNYEELVMLKQEVEKAGASIDDLIFDFINKKPQHFTLSTPTFRSPVNKSKQKSIEVKIDNKKRKIYQRSGGVCYLCGSPVQFNRMSIDHVIPRSRGGSNKIENLRATHAECNRKKSNKLIEEIGITID